MIRSSDVEKRASSTKHVRRCVVSLGPQSIATTVASYTQSYMYIYRERDRESEIERDHYIDRPPPRNHTSPTYKTHRRIRSHTSWVGHGCTNSAGIEFVHAFVTPVWMWGLDTRNDLYIYIYINIYIYIYDSVFGAIVVAMLVKSG